MSTTKPQVTYYFSFISLWSYVGSLHFQELVAKHDIDVVYKPIDLLAVFSAVGGKPVKERPLQRQAYRLVEMQRWRAQRKIDLVLHPKYYPADPALGHRLLLAALRDGQDVGAFVHASLRAVWAEELNIEDPETLVGLADRSGLQGRELLAQANAPELFAQSDVLTQEAIERQLFGAPFYFYNGEPFWGQDRLDMLDAAIAESRPPFLPPAL